MFCNKRVDILYMKLALNIPDFKEFHLVDTEVPQPAFL